MKPPVLVTGFEPFGEVAVNPSAQLAERLNGSRIWGRDVIGKTLPVEFGVAADRLIALIQKHNPAVVVCLGIAPSRRILSLERVAINLADASIPDNAGRRPIDRPIDLHGPAAFFSTLPIKAIARALSEAGIGCEISQTAGTYVCNHVFYRLMQKLKQRPRVRGGFLHVPPPRRGLSLEVMEEAIGCLISTTLRRRKDAKVPGGRVD